LRIYVLSTSYAVAATVTWDQGEIAASRKNDASESQDVREMEVSVRPSSSTPQRGHSCRLVVYQESDAGGSTHHKVHKSLVIGREAMRRCPVSIRVRARDQRIIYGPMRLKFCERLHPAEQLLAQLSRDIWTFQELFEDSDSPREVISHPNADLEIILKDTHQPHVRSRDDRERKERFAGVEGRVKLAGRHSSLRRCGTGRLATWVSSRKRLPRSKRCRFGSREWHAKQFSVSPWRRKRACWYCSCA